MRYEGRANAGRDRTEVLLRIPDVEDLHWHGLVLDPSTAETLVGEVEVTLADDGLYVGWSGSAVVMRGADGRVRFLGHEPLTPPVGA